MNRINEKTGGRLNPFEPTEADIRQRIYNYLRKCNILYFQTSAPRKSYSTRGTADIMIWFRGVWHAIEVKSRIGKLSEEQKRLQEKGAVKIVRSLDDVIEVLGA